MDGLFSVISFSLLVCMFLVFLQCTCENAFSTMAPLSRLFCCCTQFECLDFINFSILGTHISCQKNSCLDFISIILKTLRNYTWEIALINSGNFGFIAQKMKYLFKKQHTFANTTCDPMIQQHLFSLSLGLYHNSKGHGWWSSLKLEPATFGLQASKVLLNRQLKGSVQTKKNALY